LVSPGHYVPARSGDHRSGWSLTGPARSPNVTPSRRPDQQCGGAQPNAVMGIASGKSTESEHRHSDEWEPTPTNAHRVEPQLTAPSLLWVKAMARGLSSAQKASSTHAPAASPGSLEPILAQRDRLLSALTCTLGDDAEEVLQQAYERALARSHTVRAWESAVAWFARLLRNATIDHLRREAARNRAWRRWRAESEALPTLEGTEEAAVCVCVGQLIPELREAYAHVLRRIDLEDASIRDVARELGTTPNNVRVRLHRARVALRMKLLARCVGCRDGGHLDCDCPRDDEPRWSLGQARCGKGGAPMSL
jgi:RNA polymerase sigma factor (sigma-70 family)